MIHPDLDLDYKLLQSILIDHSVMTEDVQASERLLKIIEFFDENQIYSFHSVSIMEIEMFEMMIDTLDSYETEKDCDDNSISNMIEKLRFYYLSSAILHENVDLVKHLVYAGDFSIEQLKNTYTDPDTDILYFAMDCDSEELLIFLFDLGLVPDKNHIVHVKDLDFHGWHDTLEVFKKYNFI